jgi:hypothetical protein
LISKSRRKKKETHASRLGAEVTSTTPIEKLAPEKACDHWGGEGKADCIFDVLATGDLEMAMVGAY